MTTNITDQCLDINGVPIDDFQFNLDGTVVGILNTGVVNSDTSKLSYDCCTQNGWSFDPTNSKCYWAPACLNGGNYHIVLDPEGNTGGFFQIDVNERGKCYLELDFQFLLRVDCQNLVGRLIDFLQNIHLEVSLEKVIYDESLPIPNNLEEIVRVDLFKIDNILDFFRDNSNTGIILNDTAVNSGTKPTIRTCSNIINQFKADLDNLNVISANEIETIGSDVLNDFSLDSDWVNFKLVIDDPTILESISNERLKISIIGNTLSDFSIILDDIQLNKVCKTPIPPPFFDEECPKFELKRIVDNKKSWVENTSLSTREFDLSRRETNYNINHEKLSINTKEIDLALTPTQAIENDVVATIMANDCLLAPATGCTSGNTTHNCIDLRPKITTEIIDNNDLINQLIDVKNRKTLSSYPTLELLYHRYLNSLEHCGVNSNALSIDSINSFLNLIGTYWSDLLEQIVPATTIWGSTVTNSDSPIIGSTNNKFVYRKGTTFFCSSGPTYPVTSPSSGDVNYSVSVQDITGPITTVPNIEKCSTISIRQMNSGSEFLGTISIIGVGTDPIPTGSTISLTETIDDECNKFEDC